MIFLVFIFHEYSNLTAVFYAENLPYFLDAVLAGGNSTVFSSICSNQQQRKIQSSATLALCEGNYRWAPFFSFMKGQ